jgi:thiol-disulfide isomerase/thioredoxin
MITVTKFSSKTCGPCKALAPVFRELKDSGGGGCEVV